MAAIHASLVSLVQAGDRIVATNAVYGSTRSLLVNVLGPLGIRTDFVDATDHDAVAAALAAGPVRVLYTETISNPTMVVADHATLADLAHRHGAAYVVDNTFASPYVCRPLEHRGGPRHRIRDEIHRRPLRRPRRHRRRAWRPRRGRGQGPGRHRRDARPARRVPRHAWTRDARRAPRPARGNVNGTRALARASGWCAQGPPPAAPEPSRRRHRRSPVPRWERDVRLRAGRGTTGGPGVRRRAHDPGADGVARQHPHDDRPPAVDDAPPAERCRARCGGHRTGPAALLDRARGRRRPAGRFHARASKPPAGRRPRRRPPRSLRSRPPRSIGSRPVRSARTRSPAPGMRCGAC